MLMGLLTFLLQVQQQSPIRTRSQDWKFQSTPQSWIGISDFCQRNGYLVLQLNHSPVRLSGHVIPLLQPLCPKFQIQTLTGIPKPILQIIPLPDPKPYSDQEGKRWTWSIFFRLAKHWSRPRDHLKPVFVATPQGCIFTLCHWSCGVIRNLERQKIRWNLPSSSNIQHTKIKKFLDEWISACAFCDYMDLIDSK